jgi:hypothetical protein
MINTRLYWVISLNVWHSSCFSVIVSAEICDSTREDLLLTRLRG